MPLAARGLVHHPSATSFAAPLANAAAGWLRYAAVVRGSYGLALLSSIVLGFAGAVIGCSYAEIAERHFPPSQRSLATTLAVQSNYAGWALGAVLVPSCVHDARGMLAFMRAQAIVVSAGVPIFLAVHVASRAKPADAPLAATDAAHDAVADPATADRVPPAPLGALPSLVALCTNVRFIVYALSFSILGGAGFAIPAVQARCDRDALGMRSRCARDAVEMRSRCGRGRATCLHLGEIPGE